MWDQKTRINVSALEESERFSGSASNHQSIQDQKVIDSCGEDSGFLSGQNLYSSDCIEESHSDVGAAPVIEEKFRDSGAIVADDDYEQEDITKDTKQEPMIVQSGVDVGLTEWFSGMNISNSNNLSDSRKNNVQEVPKYLKLSKTTHNRLLVETCYSQDNDGDTHLHLAILGRFTQAIFAIIRLAPLPGFLDIRNDNAHSPLHLAVLSRQAEIVRCLLLAGAKATTQDKEGNTPLHLACMNSDKDCVNALTLPITNADVHYNCTDRIPQVLRPDLEQRNYHGMRCVHIAAQRNDIEILRHLVWLGADINAREGTAGYTALHFACENGNEQLAQFLLNECTKLNVEACTYGQLTAYQLAAEHKNCNLMGNLKDYGAAERSPPESDDDSYFDSSEDDMNNFYESDDCELN